MLDSLAKSYYYKPLPPFLPSFKLRIGAQKADGLQMVIASVDKHGHRPQKQNPCPAKGQIC